MGTRIPGRQRRISTMRERKVNMDLWPFDMTYHPGLLSGTRGPLTVGKPATKVDAIVVHHTVTTSPDVTFVVLRRRELSTHFEVGLDGKIRQYVPIDRRAFHAGAEWNRRSVGIDLTGPLLESAFPKCAGGPFTERQVAAAIRLIRAVAARLGIPITSATVGEWRKAPAGGPAIVPHAAIKAVKIDPGGTWRKASKKKPAKWTDDNGAFWTYFAARLIAGNG